MAQICNLASHHILALNFRISQTTFSIQINYAISEFVVGLRVWAQLKKLSVFWFTTVFNATRPEVLDKRYGCNIYDMKISIVSHLRKHNPGILNLLSELKTEQEWKSYSFLVDAPYSFVHFKQMDGDHHTQPWPIDLHIFWASPWAQAWLCECIEPSRSRILPHLTEMRSIQTCIFCSLFIVLVPYAISMRYFEVQSSDVVNMSLDHIMQYTSVAFV